MSSSLRSHFHFFSSFHPNRFNPERPSGQAQARLRPGSGSTHPTSQANENVFFVVSKCESPALMIKRRQPAGIKSTNNRTIVVSLSLKVVIAINRGSESAHTIEIGKTLWHF
ncbi:hypothetical protein PoB_002075700 [Plakobranchus ocellatus]|uniref:Uncharacterized protein n=1 Tax=Plakobranchus ocellatus TaxID=259542 RepID=A0AAV3ZI88_9GAST|nr:hypothetical protein PoB_002075700 [Plakobranchus ocellatus]